MDGRTLAAAMVAALLGYLGGAGAVDLSRSVAPLQRGIGAASPLEVAVAALPIAPFLSLPILFMLAVIALLAHVALERAGRSSVYWYAAAGAPIGAAVGALMIGWLFQGSVRGALCGVPVGLLCGAVFLWIARPYEVVAEAERPKRTRPLNFER